MIIIYVEIKKTLAFGLGHTPKSNKQSDPQNIVTFRAKLASRP